MVNFVPEADTANISTAAVLTYTSCRKILGLTLVIPLKSLKEMLLGFMFKRENTKYKG